jgi:serine/threonine protein kinase
LADLFQQVLDAVQYAHGHQVIHRDIKTVEHPGDRLRPGAAAGFRGREAPGARNNGQLLLDAAT